MASGWRQHWLHQPRRLVSVPPRGPVTVPLPEQVPPEQLLEP
jgi:hypothetical protein